MSFGNVTVNTSASQTVQVTNTGSGAVSIAQDSLTGAGFATTLTTPLSLGAGQSVNVQISFQPTVTGTVSGDLVLSSNGATVLTIPVSGSGVAAHSVDLSWIASTSSDVQGYNVYRSSVSGGPYTKISPTLSPTEITYADLTPVAGQQYFYVVTAVDSTGLESLPSNEVGVTIPSP